MARTPFDWLEHQAELADDHEHGLSGGQAEHSYQHIPFNPVPRLRARRRGWSEGRQRDTRRAASL